MRRGRSKHIIADDLLCGPDGGINADAQCCGFPLVVTSNTNQHEKDEADTARQTLTSRLGNIYLISMGSPWSKSLIIALAVFAVGEREGSTAGCQTLSHPTLAARLPTATGMTRLNSFSGL